MQLDLDEKHDHDESELLTISKDYAHKAIQVNNKYIVITQRICSDNTHHDTEDQMNERGRQTHDAILTGIINKLLA